VAALASRPVDRILSSPFVRCVETVEPLAAARGLAVEPCDELAEGRGTDSVLLVQRLAGRNVVLCTHGDVVLDVLHGLVLDGMAPAADPPAKKGSTWVLDLAGDGSGRATYLPPPSA